MPLKTLQAQSNAFCCEKGVFIVHVFKSMTMNPNYIFWQLYIAACMHMNACKDILLNELVFNILSGPVDRAN